MKNKCEKAGISGFFLTIPVSALAQLPCTKPGCQDKNNATHWPRIHTECARPNEEMLSSISKALEPNYLQELPMKKRQRSWTNLYANHRDSQYKNTFTNCKAPSISTFQKRVLCELFFLILFNRVFGHICAQKANHTLKYTLIC